MLEEIYRETLERCSPERLIRVPDAAPANVVAIGKCAAGLFRGIATYRDALVIVPAGYPRVSNVECLEGGHPDLTAASFAAGRRLLEFVDEHEDILFLISGGGSACVEWPLEGFTQQELIAANHKLVASGLAIREINTVRKQLSAIKGGKLAQRVRGRAVTMVYSDVSTGRLADVASGPTLANDTTLEEAIAILEEIDDEVLAGRLRAGYVDTRTRGLAVPPRQIRVSAKPRNLHTSHLIADNTTLVQTAAEIAKTRGLTPKTINVQIESDVDEAAAQLAVAARDLEPGEILIAGGEPTVAVRGSGQGGRCFELAARFALRNVPHVSALFASSDGVDGNSGAAGAVLPPNPAVARDRIVTELRQSNSLKAIEMLGRAIMIPPTGNNLRDLFLLARA